MTEKDKKKGLTRNLQDFLASYQGKVMLNYAYSWGAAIVIMGALFKLTHLPGANFMLFAGMGTEVLVFFISAFDRPFKSYKWESVFPNIKIAGAEYGKKKEDGEENEQPGEMDDALNKVMQAQGQPGNAASGPVIIGGGMYMPQSVQNINAGSAGEELEQNSMQVSTSNIGSSGPAVISVASASVVSPITPGVEISPEMEEATKDYLERLKEMTDALSRFVEQTKSMGQDADQINTLNKNLTGINAIYEIQLRSISTQLGTLDEINDQTKKMAVQIDELNKVYARMLEAMTVNMKASGAANI